LADLSRILRRAASLLLAAAPLLAGPRLDTEPVAGIADDAVRIDAIVGARVVPRPGAVIDSGTVVLRDGRIAAVGPSRRVQPPVGARVWDGTGQTLYAGLIEPAAEIGLPAGDDARALATHWNVNVLADLRAADRYRADAGALKELRALGFTAALVTPSTGLFRGRSALVSTAEGPLRQVLVRADVAQHVALHNPGSPSDRQENVRYPGSLMGAVALVRQTFLDADWYAHALSRRDTPPLQADPALAALGGVVDGNGLVVLQVGNERMLRTARMIVDEADLERVVLRGGGAEYRQLQRLMAMKHPVILPVAFPPAPDVSDPEDALRVSLASLWHWEAAPGNPAAVREAGVEVALTSTGLPKRSEFHAQVRRAIDHGLSAEDALAAVTSVPARFLGVDDELGTIAPGKRAHLTIADGDLFAEGTKVLALWIDGVRHVVQPAPELDLRGDWQWTAADPTLPDLRLSVEGGAVADSWSATIRRDSLDLGARHFRVDRRRLSLTVPGDSLGVVGHIRLSGHSTPEGLAGDAQFPDGHTVAWTATRLVADDNGSADDGPKEGEPKKAAGESPARGPSPAPLAPPFPPVAFGAPVPPQPDAVLVRGATIWTSGSRGILPQADLLVRKGRIAAIGTDLDAPRGAVVIDARGKHVTPGLVDAHVHAGVMGGVNEWTRAVSAEVRVGDVLNAYDARLYRFLAQGTTTVHTMHGSSNPIGGQNATLKLRWGAPAEDLLAEGAAPTIKFALGENVKHSNRGPHFTTRYPQTRMGVVELIRDRLTRAREYARSRRQDDGTRRDLQLDALVEVLEGRRLVHCHSYRQDEILALIRVAEEFGFTVGTFQHVLEGYKVAAEIAAHGAGASTFSDWWGYKYEVADATPYNAALMHFVGVGVSLNSDLSNFGGRIHVDAAKAVKYGGVSEEEALHMITIEPARQLGLQDRVGSLEPGKDADFVLWSRSPLSGTTLCEQTWIDGRRYFDRDADAERRHQVEAERARLVQAVLETSE
jgi:imidazolonepropionase-like amidohydrolase